MALQFYYALMIMERFSSYKNDQEYIRFLKEQQKDMEEKIQNLCWDNDRFIRGFTEKGERIGAAADPEANMWLNPQSWAVISGLATKEQADAALFNVYQQLNTEYGALLMNPPYHACAFDGALAVIYNQGTKENSGIFSQSQGWLILAEALMGHGERAFAWSPTATASLQKGGQANTTAAPMCTGLPAPPQRLWWGVWKEFWGFGRIWKG